MKITCLKGSPRPAGNSAKIAAAFLDEASKAGEAEIKTFELNKLKYKGCQECLKCNTKLDKCILKDDLSEVLDEIRNSELLVMASSVFYGDVTGQLKLCIDRMYSFLHYDYDNFVVTPRIKDKKLVMILSQGQPDESMFADIFPRYNFFFTNMGFSDTRLIRACGLPPYQKPGEDVLEQARETARQVMNGG